MTRTVHTTMQPGRPIEVDDVEWLDLHRAGLLLDAEPTADGGAPAGPHADMHPGQPPIEAVPDAEDAAALDQTVTTDPTEPDSQETPA